MGGGGWVVTLLRSRDVQIQAAALTALSSWLSFTLLGFPQEYLIQVHIARDLHFYGRLTL